MRLRNKFLNTKSELDRKMYDKKHNYCVTLIRKAKQTFFFDINAIDTQVLRRFKPCSQRVGDPWWWGSLTMVPAGNKAKRLSSVNNTTKTIIIMIKQIELSGKRLHLFSQIVTTRSKIHCTKKRFFINFSFFIKDFFSKCDQFRSFLNP